MGGTLHILLALRKSACAAQNCLRGAKLPAVALVRKLCYTNCYHTGVAPGWFYLAVFNHLLGWRVCMDRYKLLITGGA